MKKVFLSLSITFFLLLGNNVFAQKLPFKFGKVSAEEMKMTQCDFYPEAKAMVLGEYGVLNILYDDHDGWKYEIKTVVRKKIFDIAEGEQGNIKIQLYEPVRDKGNGKEEINSFKAFTYNLENGKTVSKKVGNRDLFKTRINDFLVEASIALPNIQNGSVIEYSYIKESDYIINLETWQFQQDIPVALSEFRYTIPEWFSYQIAQGGNLKLAESTTKDVMETFRFDWKSMPGIGGKIESGTNVVSIKSEMFIDVMKNIPPLEDEPYICNPTDIPARLNFQLISIAPPGQPIDYYAGDYTKFNNKLLLNYFFGDRLNKGIFIRKILGKMEGETTKEKAKTVHDFIANHFSWNEIYNYKSEIAGKEAYDKMTGTIGDINLTLVAAMRSVGLDAYPVILSTRGHGTVHELYPNSDEFNYVIVAVVDGDKTYLCDATTKIPFGQLPLKCRNGKGWLVKEPKGEWIDLKASAKYNTTTMLTAEITDSQIVTEVAQRRMNYAATLAYQNIEETTEAAYTKDLEEIFEDGTVKSLSLPKVDFNKPATIKYELVRENKDANMIYLQPIQLGTILKNPFQREERFSVIDFPYTQSRHVIFNLDLPEGYTAELPEATIVKLPAEQGEFSYNVSQTGNKISIVSKVSINNTVFSVAEYATLKEFYELIANKHQEPIVLKK